MKAQKSSPNVCLGLDELNLAEYPIALLTDKTTISLGKKTIEIVEKGFDEKGNPVERKWVVTGSDKYGLPVGPDDEVLMCLLEITKERTNFENRNVPLSAYDIIKRMGWREEGKSYQRVKESLARLKGVSIIAENVFWNNNNKSYSTMGFGIIDDYKIENPKKKKRADDDNTQTPFPFLSYIAWNQKLFHSFQNGNLKSINLALWRSWEHPITKRLHRYLDKHFYWTDTIIVPLTKLADVIPLPESQMRYASGIKRELNKAAAEMVKAGYIERWEYQKKSDGEYAVFYRSQRYSSKQNESSFIQNDLLMRLTSAGVSEVKAQSLIQAQAPALIQDWLDHLPFVKNVQEPAAYLVSAIEGRWQIPAAAKKARKKYNEAQEKNSESDKFQNLTPEEQVEQRLKVWELTFPFHNNRQPTAEEIEKKRSELHEFYKKDKSDEDKPCAQ